MKHDPAIPICHLLRPQFFYAAFLVIFATCLGCDRIVDKEVILNVNIHETTQGGIQRKFTPLPDNLRVFINGNYYNERGGWCFTGYADKYLKPGRNTIQVEGVVAEPVDIELYALDVDRRIRTRAILKQDLVNMKESGKWDGEFWVTKTNNLPIYEKNNDLPNAAQSEQEISAIVRELYRACVSSNKTEFLRLSLEGSKYYAQDYSELERALGQLCDHFDLKPFPDTLHFIHGRNLVCVYSSATNGCLSLFDSVTKNGCGIRGVDFAYITGRWVIW